MGVAALILTQQEEAGVGHSTNLPSPKLAGDRGHPGKDTDCRGLGIRFRSVLESADTKPYLAPIIKLQNGLYPVPGNTKPVFEIHDPHVFSSKPDQSRAAPAMTPVCSALASARSSTTAPRAKLSGKRAEYTLLAAAVGRCEQFSSGGRRNIEDRRPSARMRRSSAPAWFAERLLQLAKSERPCSSNRGFAVKDRRRRAEPSCAASAAIAGKLCVQSWSLRVRMRTPFGSTCTAIR
jgi:hypothetical protein